nr:hypothetical protein [Tanacetum cinerariifolium]
DSDDEPSDGDKDDTEHEDPEEEPFEENDEEEEEHPAPADSPVVPTVDLRACLTTLGFEIGESFVAGAARQPGPTESDLRRCRVEQEGYGITDTWDEIVDNMMEIAPTTLEGVNERVTELDSTVRQRTDEFEVRFEDAQFDRDLLRSRVNTLYRDRPDHRRTAMLM